MKIEELREKLRKTEKKIVFGPNGIGKEIYHHCMEYDSLNKILKFNTDHPDYYKMSGKLEEVISILKLKFEIRKCEIEVVHVGSSGVDLDISLDLKEFDENKIVEIVNFVMDEFFHHSKNWKSRLY